MVRLALPVAEHSVFFLPTPYLLAELEWVLVSNPFRLYPLYLQFTALPHYPFKQMPLGTAGTLELCSRKYWWDNIIQFA